MQARRDRECRVHANYAGIEIEFGNAFEASCRTLFDAYAAALAVVHQNLVEPVRTHRTHNTWLRADQITVIASVAGAATETPARLFARLLLRIRQDDFLLGAAPRHRRKHGLLDAREVRKIGHVHAV